MTTAMAVPEVRSIATVHELGVEDVVAQVQKIQRVMEATMKSGEHYGVIPGTGDKPSLLKPGAEKLCLLFRLDPQYEVTSTVDGAHLTVVSRCTLYHIPTSLRMGSGMGSCSTKESKYGYRQAKRVCPKCGHDTIHRSKYPPRQKPEAEPGWYCHAKAGGCGREYAATDSAITDQPSGRVPNPDLPDQYNTVLKMSNKRALVAAVLNVTAASDIFTQDLEDYVAAPPRDVTPTPSAPVAESTPVDGPVELEPESGRPEVPPASSAPAHWELVVNDYVERFDRATTPAEAEGWRQQWLKIRATVPEPGRITVQAAVLKVQERFRGKA